jgi:hypothetical protein
LAGQRPEKSGLSLPSDNLDLDVAQRRLHNLTVTSKTNLQNREHEVSKQSWGSEEELVTFMLQSEFARWQPWGSVGFSAYEMKRNELLHLLRKPRGRPRSREVSLATELEARGVPRKDIYRQFNKTTQQQQRALSEAMRQRRFRQKRAEVET